MKRPSAVRKLPTVGFTGMCGGAESGAGGCTVFVSAALVSHNAIAHAPTPMSDTSTIDGSPVRSRANSAAAIPPAIMAPPIESPYAPAGWPIYRGLSGGVVPHAEPIRDQKVDPS